METATTQIGRHPRYRGVGAALIGVGALLLVLSGGYYAYGAWASSNLDKLNVTRARPAGLEATAVVLSASAGAAVRGGEATPKASGQVDLPASVGAAVHSGEATPQAFGQVDLPVSTVSVKSLPTAESPAALESRPSAERTAAGAAELAVNAGARVGPQGRVLARASGAGDRTEKLGLAAALGPTPVPASGGAEPSLAETGSGGAGGVQMPTFKDPRAAQLAEAIAASRLEAALFSPPGSVDLNGGPLVPATRIRIPAVGIDSHIKELAVIRTADSVAWETPKHIVGHIPTTSVAGDGGQGWYFGHLESPIRGEGNVFQRLPEIAELLKADGDTPIYIFLESEGRKFIYQVYHTEVVTREELLISDSGNRDITLVTCTPRFVYDQRLLVTAALVGVLNS